MVHGKKGSFLKSRGDVQEDELKLGKKPNLTTWGTEKEGKKDCCTPKSMEKSSRKKSNTSRELLRLFDGVYQSIVNGKQEPVTAQDGVNVMRIIEAAFQSSNQKKVIHL